MGGSSCIVAHDFLYLLSLYCYYCYYLDTPCSRVTFDDMLNTVKGQGAAVVYYSFLNDTLLIWILHAAKGLARYAYLPD